MNHLLLLLSVGGVKEVYVVLLILFSFPEVVYTATSSCYECSLRPSSLGVSSNSGDTGGNNTDLQMDRAAWGEARDLRS